MISQIGGFEDVIETGRSTAQNIKKSATAGAVNFAKTTTGQITGSQASVTPQNDQGTNEAATAAQKQMSDDQAKQFLKDLYGPTKPQGGDIKNSGNKPAAQNSNQSLIQQVAGITPKNPNEGKKPEEIAKMQSLRNTLHQEYYQNLTNPQKPKEESITEKLENEKQLEQLEEVEKEKKKPDPLATVKKGTGETMVGVSG
jgi:hypothetical protein